MIVTNKHVARAGKLFVDLGAVKLPVAVEHEDATNDIAILSSGAELNLRPLPLAEESPKPGTTVFAIGNPAGLEKSITTGVVSGIRDFDGRQLLQISAPISPGSSGGPILNTRGEVVGVAVGTLERGQNLNFAVPVLFLKKLLSGEAEPERDVASLLQELGELIEARSKVEVSNEPSSDYAKLEEEINVLLEHAVERAGSDPSTLLLIAEKAQYENPDLAIGAAERALRTKQTTDGNLTLAKILQWKAIFVSEEQKMEFLKRAELALRTALHISKLPTADLYYHLADVLEDRGAHSDAEDNYRRALQMNRTDAELNANCYRGLTKVAYALGKPSEGSAWFRRLVESGKANFFDWRWKGEALFQAKQYEEAGQSYQQAALRGGSWTDWCDAASSYGQTGKDDDDQVLTCARKCIEAGAGKKGSESRLALAHLQLAFVLNRRGVFQEALSHARETIALDPSNGWAFDAQAQALRGLRRFQEAINASNQAIRLTDGSFSAMHFALGLSYFDVENWEFAKQSFEKSAQMEPKDDAAAYNVALCFLRLGYYRDAANWLEEVLRRNPNHRNRPDILERIQRLRQ